jgi:hypothetical protein
MKRFALLVALFVGLTSAPSALAAGYGAAGCGWGSTLIKENKKGAQLGAWFLNGLLSNQTFGISSGTSGCGASGLVLAEKEQEAFVANNYHSLAREMAAGEGEDLYTLAGLLGCPVEQAADFGAFTQKNYPAIFKSDNTTPVEMLDALKKGLSGNPGLVSSCNKL